VVTPNPVGGRPTVPASVRRPTMPRVRIFSWNPRRSTLPPRLTRRLPVGHRLNNFGDLLGPLVVSKILARHGISPSQGRRECTLFSVGSVLHFAHDDDVVWGSGVNGKMPTESYLFHRLDVRAVRGPLTRDFLQSRGIVVPVTFGDPALLLPRLAPELFAAVRRDEHAVTVVPNFNDFPAYLAEPDVLDPRAPLDACLRRIAGSRLVVGSSLHGIVVAESLGIPARVIASEVEHPFKYLDYYRGTGRHDVEAAGSVQEAVAMGGRELPEFDAEGLIAAFPVDLWAEPRISPPASPPAGQSDGRAAEPGDRSGYATS
jgi:pyruvyltransferase